MASLTFVFLTLVSLLLFSVSTSPLTFAQYVEDEVIVQFHENTSEQTIDEIIGECGTIIVDKMTIELDIYLMKIQEQKTVQETIVCFENFENVKYAEPNALYTIFDETIQYIIENEEEYEHKVSEISNMASKPSPKKQMNQGLLPQDVTCSDDLVLILKLNQNTSACIFMKSVDKLVKRGWGIPASEANVFHPFDVCRDSISLHYDEKDSDSKIMKKLRMEISEQHLFRGNNVWFFIHISESDDGKNVSFYTKKLPLDDRSVLKNNLEKLDGVSQVQIFNTCTT